MSRAEPFYRPLEEALIDFDLWERNAEADGAVTPDETFGLYLAIRERRRPLSSVLRSCRAVSVVINTELGIDSPTTDRVLRELRRSA